MASADQQWLAAVQLITQSLQARARDTVCTLQFTHNPSQPQWKNLIEHKAGGVPGLLHSFSIVPQQVMYSMHVHVCPLWVLM
jgi:hypothetical protein